MDLEPRQLSELQRTFDPPRGLGGARPRDIVLTGAGKALVATTIALWATALAVGIILNRIVDEQAEVRRAFADTGVVARAEVARLWRATGDGKPAFVAYRFDAGGVPHGGSVKIPLSWWRSLTVGAPLTVRYLPADPGRNVLVGAEPQGIPRALGILFPAGISCFAFFCGLLLRRQRRLLSEGRATPAIITSVKKVHTSHGGTYRSLTYAFPLLSGAIATGKSATARKAPDVGSTVCVVYDPERPSRSQPYPFALVRPDVG